jgi:hypothetical protein
MRGYDAYNSGQYNDLVKRLLYEYYVYKVRQKQVEKEKKAVKEICNFLLDNECLEIVKDCPKDEQLLKLNEMI